MHSKFNKLYIDFWRENSNYVFLYEWTVFENHQKSLIFNFVYRYGNNLSLDYYEDSYVDFWRENSNYVAFYEWTLDSV